MIERRPLWPPWLPPSRKRIFPKGRLNSSVTTSSSWSGARSRAISLRTATPESFMNVSGFASTRSRLRKRPCTTALASRVRPRPAQPARSASRSTTIQPMLWRVFAYCSPGFPSPTTTFTLPPRGGGRSRGTLNGPNPTWIGPLSGWYRAPEGVAHPASRSGSPGGEDRPLQRPHCGLLGGLRVVPAAEVEPAMDHEQADVAGLAAAALGRLEDGALDGDDDVAEMEPRPRRQEECPPGGGAWRRGRDRPTGMRRVRLRRQEREREDVGRARLPEERPVETGQLWVVGKDEADRGGLRRPSRHERRPEGARESGGGQRARHAGPDLQVHAERGHVEPARAKGRPGRGHVPRPTEPASRRASSSTILFCG